MATAMQQIQSQLPPGASITGVIGAFLHGIDGRTMHVDVWGYGHRIYRPDPDQLPVRSPFIALVEYEIGEKKHTIAVNLGMPYR